MTDILREAGERARDAAMAMWRSEIIDPKANTFAPDERSREAIDGMIRSTSGLAWSWHKPYQHDGDFEWCGAFAFGHCWGAAGIDLDQRRLYGSSTDRLNAWAQYEPLFDSGNERLVMDRFPRPKDGSGRKWLALDEDSGLGEVFLFEPRAGDILLVGGLPGSYRGARDHGTHVAIVHSWDPDRGGFETIDGNKAGEGPDGTFYQGVTANYYAVGLQRGAKPSTFHVRRIIRPSVHDLTMLGDV